MRLSRRLTPCFTATRLAAAIASVVAALAFAGVAAAMPGAHGTPAVAGHPTRVIAACTKAQYKPTQYVITCADANIQLKKATYEWWSHRTAHGSGIYYFNDCIPTCVAGTFHSQRATFTLYRVVQTTDFGPLFSRIEVDTRQGHHVFWLPTSTL